MRDGRTRKLEAAAPVGDFEGFRLDHEIFLVVEVGGDEGSEHPIEAERVTLGRGSDVDLRFRDEAMSRVHAAIEFENGSFRLRDLGSLNGIAVNGSNMLVADLKHGDKLRVGEHEFRFLVQERPSRTPVHDLDEA